MYFNHQIEQAISTPRLGGYRDHEATDDQAWALYRWNIDLSAAVTPLAADLEVTLRNTIHDQLADHFGRADWWASPTLLLDDITSDMLAEVVRKQQHKITRGTVGPGKVIAGATLGVWVHLLGRGGHSASGRAIDYEAKLWRPAIRFGFSTGTLTPSGRERRPTRADVYHRAHLFQRLRNRAAHHEPIFNGISTRGSGLCIDLADVWALSVELLGWMCPDLAKWHRNQGLLPAVLARRPGS